MKHHTPNERQGIFKKFWTEELKTKQNNKNNNNNVSFSIGLAVYLGIFSVQIKGWIPRDGHVVIIINTRLQITNLTKVSTYQH